MNRVIFKQTLFVVYIFLILTCANDVPLKRTLQMISWHLGQVYSSCYNLLLNIYIRGLYPIAKQPEVRVTVHAISCQYVFCKVTTFVSFLSIISVKLNHCTDHAHLLVSE